MTAVSSGATPAPSAVDSLTTKTAIEWRKDRDKQSPLKRDLRAERLALIRETIVDVLWPAVNDLKSCLGSLENADDVGADHHFRRVIVAVKAVVPGFRELTPAQAQKADAA